MATWENTNLACATLWTTLYHMNQLHTNFDDSGALKMSDLTFYNPLSSGDARAQEAKMVADQIDNTFINGRGAKYEEGTTTTIAVNGLVAILTDENQQVQDLAAKADELYIFWGEQENQES